MRPRAPLPERPAPMRLLRRAIAAVTLLWGLSAGISEAASVRHALVVGVNDGGGVLEPLRYAERDAEKFADVLVELGDFDEQLVTVLYAPTAEQLRHALARHAAVAEQYDDDLFLFYYSGHADGQGLRLGSDRYWFESLKHDLRVIDSGVRIGVLDACRSGAVTRSKGAAITESIIGLQRQVAEGEVWLTASAADEAAQESDRLRGGFFTHYLISGMRGAADRGDQVVDLDELRLYTYDQVVASTGATVAGVQHPNFAYNLTGSGRVYLTDLRNASAMLTLPSDVSGHVSLMRLPDRAQIAEFGKVSGAELQLAVPPGRYLVRRRDGDDLYDVTVGINEGASLTVTSWGVSRLEAAARRGADARIGQYVDLSVDHERRLNLASSPVVAGAASLVIPGAGQLYNGQAWRGALYFGATSALLAGVIFGRSGDFDPRFSAALGAGLWGASVADAVYNVHRREGPRPRLGGQVGWGAAFGGHHWPYHMGFNADLMLRPGLSIGLDRVGVTGYRDGGWDAHVGSRLMVAKEGPRWRPGGFVAFGVRHGRVPGQDLRLTRAVFGAGANLRYYFVPRYFTEVETRWEQGGEADGLVSGVGMGVHLGR